MLIHSLEKDKLIHPPKWLSDNTHYLTIMGSDAYGVSGGSSDIDVYGFCIPPKELTFPHLAGEIQGFGTQLKRFEQWSEHHVKTVDGAKEYDFAVYSIVKYFDLCMGCNPNMIDSMFVPRRCILHSTHIGELVRENRHMFLHKRAWHTFKGYAYSQITKYKPDRRDSLKPIAEFQNTHMISNSNIINNLRNELNRRRITHGIQDSRFDGNNVRPIDPSTKTE